jgi:2-dehydro-3-deoxygalactonokinase
MPKTSAAKATICVDMGTTNTRVWIVHEETIVARIDEQVGLRDAARQRNPSLVRNTLSTLLSTARSRAADLNVNVECVLAAGMLTSPLGLCEVPHLVAPAGENELARSLHKFSDPTVTDLPMYLVPGVRSGPASPSLDDLDNTDLLRGEETIVIGLLQLGILSAGATLLNLGSHWKAIAIDQQSCIASSFTTLSGEFLHALQTQTVLASALPHTRIEDVDPEWLDRGKEFENRNGPGRAMFAVRLLEQLFHVSPTALSSFLLGALVESERLSMERASILKDPIVLTGAGAAPKAWLHALASTGHRVQSCSPEILDQACTQGLLRLSHLHDKNLSS